MTSCRGRMGCQPWAICIRMRRRNSSSGRKSVRSGVAMFTPPRPRSHRHSTIASASVLARSPGGRRWPPCRVSQLSTRPGQLECVVRGIGFRVSGYVMPVRRQSPSLLAQPQDQLRRLHVLRGGELRILDMLAGARVVLDADRPCRLPVRRDRRCPCGARTGRRFRPARRRSGMPGPSISRPGRYFGPPKALCAVISALSVPPSVMCRTISSMTRDSLRA